MAKKMPANRTNALPADVEEALANVDRPGIIKIGDWACPYGHFNTSLNWTCARCKREGKWMSSIHVYKLATDEATIVELRDFLQQCKLEQNLARPGS